MDEVVRSSPAGRAQASKVCLAAAKRTPDAWREAAGRPFPAKTASADAFGGRRKGSLARRPLKGPPGGRSAGGLPSSLRGASLAGSVPAGDRVVWELGQTCEAAGNGTKSLRVSNRCFICLFSESLICTLAKHFEFIKSLELLS